MSPTVLGIVNVTSDAVSDGGEHVDLAAAMIGAEQLIAEGADMIGIGFPSTSPSTSPSAGAPSVEDELALVVPAVEAITPFAPVAVETGSEAVARAGVAAGAQQIIDLGASLAPLAAELGVGWIAVHRSGSSEHAAARGVGGQHPPSGDVVEQVVAVLDDRAGVAQRLGVERIWIDPGFGSGKDIDDEIRLLANLGRLVATGWPVAVGTSSVAATTYALACGVDLIRAHDVKATRQAVSVVAGRSPAQSRSS